MDDLYKSDFISAAPTQNFTIVPNELGRCAEVSGTAFKVLFIILSNNDGWKTRVTQIRKQMKEGKQAITTAIRQLKSAGFLRRYIVFNSDGKIHSKFYAATSIAGVFNIQEREDILTEMGYNIKMEIPRKSENGVMGVPHPSEKPDGWGSRTGGEAGRVGNPAPKNTNLKENDTKRKSSLKENPLTDESVMRERPMKIVSPSGRTRNKPVPKESEPLHAPKSKSKKDSDKVANIHKRYARQLYNIVTSNKTLPKTALAASKRDMGWPVHFYRLIERDGFEKDIVQEALDWYGENIGSKYTPVIDCGEAFRRKFIKVQAAIQREKKPHQARVTTNKGRKHLTTTEGNRRIVGAQLTADDLKADTV